MRTPLPVGICSTLDTGAAAAGRSAPPLGNTGVSDYDDPFAVGVDALSVTFFPWPADRLWTSQEGMARAAGEWLAEVAPVLLPRLDLADEAGGRHGYSRSRQILRSARPVGVVRYGGNRGSVSMELTGSSADSVDVDSWSALSRSIPGYRITRLDAAFDDFGSSYRTYSDWRRAALSGAFRSPRGRLPLTREHDDHGTGQGRTLYIGSAKSSRMIRIYEKGHQLDIRDLPSWVRVEAQIRKGDRVITWEHVRDPAGTLRSISGLVGLPVAGLPRGLERAQQVEDAAAVERNFQWLRTAAGPSLARYVQVVGAETAATVIQRAGVSALERAGLSEEQARAGIQELLGGLAAID